MLDCHSDERGHRALKVHGKDGEIILVPPPPAFARAIDHTVEGRGDGLILRNTPRAPG